MVDATHIGRVFPPHTVVVEAGRLRQFARAIGETRPEYTDEAAARAAGHPSLPAPPTFAVFLIFDLPDPLAWFREIEVDVARVLHSAEGFRYFAPIHAGDHLTVTSRIADVVQKKGGALTFFLKVTDVIDQHGKRVAEVRGTLVVR